MKKKNEMRSKNGMQTERERERDSMICTEHNYDRVQSPYVLVFSKLTHLHTHTHTEWMCVNCMYTMNPFLSSVRVGM